MAYNFTKLSEAPIVDSTEVTPNILIEDDGDIKRISADDLTNPQVNADWNETDVTSPAFILNKPEFIGGGGANVVTYSISYITNSGVDVADHLVYTNDSGSYITVTAQEIVDAWDDGAIIRINDPKFIRHKGQVLGIYYTEGSSGAVTSANISYFLSSSIRNMTVY